MRGYGHQAISESNSIGRFPHSKAEPAGNLIAWEKFGIMNFRMRFRRYSALCAGSLSFVGATAAGIAAPVFYPKPGLVDQSTGLMESLVGGYWYRGSAVVARDPHLLFSCAHLFYEQREWASDYYFHRAHNAKGYPPEGSGASPRGFHYFTSYSSGVNAYGQDSDVAFASDFTVFYANKEMAPDAVDWWPKGGPALRSGKSKRIVGYPSRVDFTGANGHCYQHATDWFSYDAYKVLSGFNEFQDVSTGPGNSGGPVFVHDPTSGNDRLAGILVSGSRRTAGVIALDLSTHTLSSYALGEEDQALTFSNAVARALPDPGGSDTVFPIQVSGFSGTIQKIKLSLNVSTTRRGDLNVYLKSPSGRIAWINKQSSDSGDNLILNGQNLTNRFGGFAPNGQWEIHIRDTTPGVQAVFNSYSLAITGL